MQKEASDEEPITNRSRKFEGNQSSENQCYCQLCSPQNADSICSSCNQSAIIMQCCVLHSGRLNSISQQLQIKSILLRNRPDVHYILLLLPLISCHLAILTGGQLLDYSNCPRRYSFLGTSNLTYSVILWKTLSSTYHTNSIVRMLQCTTVHR